mmetsp:Transcript_61095/g.177091  ORF Transcript_61095/g.177091 Transcript_61095/m.177091 type:complete len:1146 (+) Transcript_61095:118-3555(+)
MSDVSELEAELIKRNREIAKARDDVLKVERKLEDAQMRNDDLLEKLAELDGDNNKKSSAMRELEQKVADLEKKLAEAEESAETLKLSHEKELEQLRADFLEKESSREQDKEGQAALEAQIKALEEQVASLKQKLEEEEHRHADTKANLSHAENSSRDSASRSVEQRRMIAELQEELQQRSTFVPVEQANRLEEERCKLRDELAVAQSALIEHKSVREDLEESSVDDRRRLSALQDELAEAQAHAERHGDTLALCEAARDKVLGEYEEHRRMHDELISAERKRVDDELRKATQQAASLDGRLAGQRMLLEEASEALAQSEEQEARVAAELTAKLLALQSEHDAAVAALGEHRDMTAQAAEKERAQRVSELEALELCLERQAKSEVDAAQRGEAEAAERHRRLEARLSSLTEDQAEEQERHNRQQESLRGQVADLRQRLLEAEELVGRHQQERDTLKKDLDEAGLQEERTRVAHRQELERLQQALEAEMQSRSSAEKVAQSQLEEKDTLLQHRDSAITRLEADLEASKQKVRDLEGAVSKARADNDESSHALKLQNAKLEGELRTRHERLTEVEARLESQRQYLEQLSDSLSKAQTDRDSLMETKGSLEQQLHLEVTQKDAVSASLKELYDESTQRCQNLEATLTQEREAHRQAMDDLQRSLGDDLQKSSERQASLQSELVTTRQQYETVLRNKADLQEEVGQQREQRTTLEAKLQEHRAEQERVAVEMEQLRNSKSSLEEEVSRLEGERRERDQKISALDAQIRAGEDQRNAQIDDFKTKVHELDALIKREQEAREAAERALAAERENVEQRAAQLVQERKQAELGLQSSLDSWRDKAEEAQAQLALFRDQAEAQRARADDVDAQRRETEAQLRGEVATVEARLRRVEAEAQRAQVAVEDGKAALAAQKAEASAKIAALQQQLAAELADGKDARIGREAAEKELARQSEERRQMMERLRMASEELTLRQSEFALDKQRLSGALEESRRTLRNSLGVAAPVSAVDTGRIAALEQQLADERRRSVEQAVALQRAERRGAQFEDSNRRSEEQRAEAAQRAREAERQRALVSEELRTLQREQEKLASAAAQGRERAAMAAAELDTARHDAKYELAKTRGALDELRHMLRMQDGTSRRSLGSIRPSLTPAA